MAWESKRMKNKVKWNWKYQAKTTHETIEGVFIFEKVYEYLQIREDAKITTWKEAGRMNLFPRDKKKRRTLDWYEIKIKRELKRPTKSKCQRLENHVIEKVDERLQD
jgi:hypothetical protein